MAKAEKKSAPGEKATQKKPVAPAGKTPKAAKAVEGGKVVKGAQKAARPASAPRTPTRLREKYAREILPALLRRFGYRNPMQAPRLRKVVVNVGLGEAAQNAKLMEGVVHNLSAITGQRPIITRAKKSIAGFKIREGMPIGCMVTLRRDRMYEFLDRLIHAGLPRIRDFKGVSGKAFDGKGNYTLGLREQFIFPEIVYDKVETVHGMDIAIVSTARTNEVGKSLLELFGMPFRN
ncbi:MAG: 50S ribosomal protein L5 [Nitrospirae bacterium]|nr:50S ribosomal protein L5 [Nitrospirota bacterium]